MSSPNRNPRFSRLLASSLGSPFLTTEDFTFDTERHNDNNNNNHHNTFVRAASEPPSLSLSPPLNNTNDFSRPRTPPARPNSPSPSTAGFSIIGPEEAAAASWSTYNTPYKTFGSLGRRAAVRSTPTLSYFGSSPTTFGSPKKSLLPRLWDVIVSSPSKGSPRPALTESNSRHTVYNYSPLSTPMRKGKEKSSYKKDIFANGEYGGHVDYISLPPLDGDDGELIDDEACFVAVDFWGVGIEPGRARAVTGIDVLSLLPPELALHILVLLASHPTPTANVTLTQPNVEQSFDPLQAVLACLSVSRHWRNLASDNTVWRALFHSRWGMINVRKVEDYLNRQQCHRRKQGLQIRKSLKPRESMVVRNSVSVVVNTSNLDKKLPPLPPDAEIELLSPRSRSSSLASVINPAPLTLNWHNLYRERLELERRWTGTAHIAFSPKSSRSSTWSVSSRTSTPDFASSNENLTRVRDKWEPKVLKISGHKDSVYCLELTAQYIVTGSRDRTIKVWSQKTGRCLGTFGRLLGDDSDDEFSGVVHGHKGSVLCLKILLDDVPVGVENSKSNLGMKRGVMYSGSSDCKVFVWDVYVKSRSLRKRPSPWSRGRDWRVSQHEFSSDGCEGDDDHEVKAKVRSVLRGHSGGVLDLRVDEKWIVSCSKDAAIRVWNRQTEELHRTLRGHEGPVNAVGLEGGRVVSASGDGKMILWDIVTGERLRTLDGHDRGLACIEFKDGLIVSGSNDCKIKVWSAATGECLKTLVGHEALVRALAFDPRSGRLVSASYDKTVRVWDVASGNTVQEFRNIHSSHIFDVKFDASRIVSAAHDHNIVVLDLGHGLPSSALFI